MVMPGQGWWLVPDDTAVMGVARRGWRKRGGERTCCRSPQMALSPVVIEYLLGPMQGIQTWKVASRDARNATIPGAYTV